MHSLLYFIRLYTPYNLMLRQLGINNTYTCNYIYIIIYLCGTTKMRFRKFSVQCLPSAILQIYSHMPIYALMYYTCQNGQMIKCRYLLSYICTVHRFLYNYSVYSIIPSHYNDLPKIRFIFHARSRKRSKEQL